MDDDGIYFHDHQAETMRVLSVIASCLSIGAGLLAFYLYISMRVKVFRHHLILLLLMFDFGKAVVLLWYPARVLLVPSAYNNRNFCQVVGFFTSAFIEGADIAVLALAIHTALLIFRKFSGPEGGLYKYRYYVYAINFFVPIFMASLAFINKPRSFSPLVTWCYLPVKPYWYRLVLSWIPRYLILVSILAIYLSIYIYVKLEYRKVIKDYKTSQTYIDDSAPGDDDKDQKSFLTRVKNFFTPSFAKNKEPLTTKRVAILIVYPIFRFISYFPGFSFMEPSRIFYSPSTGANNIDMAIRGFQEDSMARFQMRRNMIERQIRSIFLYPVAYVFLWIAPFAAQVLLYNYEPEHGAVYWVNAIAAFMQPFNCVVDTAVFCIRERPWVDREEKIFTRENADWIKYTFWRMIPCASQERKTPKAETSSNSNSNTRPEPKANNKYSPNSNSAFLSFDADLERLANNYNPGSSSNPVAKSAITTASNNTDSSADTVTAHSPAKDADQRKSSNTNGANNVSRNTTLRHDSDVFASTAHRVEFDNNGQSDDSEGEMDLMEFLR